MITISKSSILSYAWVIARYAAAQSGEPVRSKIGTAMRRAWAEAKAAAVATIPQVAQQQQADASAKPAAVDHSTVEGIRALLVGRTATITLPMGEVTYRITGVRRWVSADGAQVRDYIDVIDEGMARDDRKGPMGLNIVRAGTGRGARHDSPVGQVRYSYGKFCTSGSKKVAADQLVQDLFDIALQEPAPAMVPLPVQQQQACAAPAMAPSKVSEAKAEVERLEAKCASLREEKNQALALLREFREERLAAVAGELYACPGVCWTNEERARVNYDEACEKLDQCTDDYWEALDYLSDEEREERRASLASRIAQGPSMVLQASEQQQACAAAPVQHPVGTPTDGWLDEEVRAYVDSVIRELMQPVESEQDCQMPEEADSAFAAFRATKAWVTTFEQWRDDPMSVPFGTIFSARQAMQDAHARLDALNAGAR